MVLLVTSEFRLRTINKMYTFWYDVLLQYVQTMGWYVHIRRRKRFSTPVVKVQSWLVCFYCAFDCSVCICMWNGTLCAPPTPPSPPLPLSPSPPSCAPPPPPSPPPETAGCFANSPILVWSLWVRMKPNSFVPPSSPVHNCGWYYLLQLWLSLLLNMFEFTGGGGGGVTSQRAYILAG